MFLLTRCARAIAAAATLAVAAAPAGSSPTAVDQTPALGEVVTGEPTFRAAPRARPADAQPTDVAPEHAGCARGVRITAGPGTQRLWDVEWSARNAAAVRAGAAVLATVRVRADDARNEQQTATVRLYVQLDREPWTKLAVLDADIGAEWTRLDLPATTDRRYGPGELAVVLGAGVPDQAVAAACLRLSVFPEGVAARDLPRFQPTYAGREPGAPWRARAAERIAALRTAELRIRVLDHDGSPRENAPVNVTLVDPAFLFGTAVDARALTGRHEKPHRALTEADRERYRATVAEMFNAATIENGLKWGPWEEPGWRAATLEALEWLASRDLRVRGHALIWPSRKHAPDRADALFGEPGRLRELIVGAVRQRAEAARGRVVHWDVVNEPRVQGEFIDLLGEAEAARWFRIARDTDPDARLFVNEFGILSGPHGDELIDWTRRVRELGGPIDGVGIQGHFGTQPRGIDSAERVLDRFHDAGLRVVITEFDVDSPDAELQGDYLRDLLTLAYSHPAVEGFMVWGFYAPLHWRPRAAMFAADWSERPTARAWRRLVLDEWRTTESVRTDADGWAVVRGHHGQYRLRAVGEAPGEESSTLVTLGPGGRTVVLGGPGDR